MQVNEIEKFISDYKGKSHSELKQDILALAVSDSKQNGFFVEFGIMDGIYASNTYLLESQFDWQGIVCEPGKVFHEKIKSQRKCSVDFRAVASKSGDQLAFKETQTQLGLSGLVDYFNPIERHTKKRKSSEGETYLVETVSLADLLEQHDAPEHIDYISMDTEGSELAILENFNFSKYKISLFTIEHNFVDVYRDSIKKIMERNNYINILANRSKYDDWYIHSSLLEV